MFDTVAQVLITFSICLAVGFVCTRRKMIDQHIVKGVSALLMNVIMPSLVIVSMQKPFSPSLFRESMFFLLLSMGIYAVSIPIGFLLCRLMKIPASEKGLWIFVMVFPNVGTIGIPLVEAIYGKDALFYVTMNVLAYNLFQYTVGVYIMNLYREDKEPFPIKSLLNFPLLAIFLGFLFFLISYTIPTPVYKALDMIGSMTTPMSMFMVGAGLTEIKPIEFFNDKKVYVASFFRLLAIPFFIYIVGRAIIPNLMMRNVLVLLLATPVAVSTTMLAARYNADYALASKFVLITTVLSLFTIPIVSLLLV